MTNLPRILITPGEPAGIGPDVTIATAQQDWPASIIAVTDANLLADRAKQLNLPLTIQRIDLANHTPTAHKAGTMLVSHIELARPARPGELNTDNAPFVVSCLKQAGQACMTHHADAIVTGPVQKSVISAAGVPFSGHTEFFAELSDTPLTVMMFAIDDVKVALASTHIPLHQVPAAITAGKLQAVITVLQKELQTRFHIASPNIVVTGLNPHAGENGHLGREEIDIIIPTLHALRNQGITIEGPLPADTAFLPHVLEKADVVLAMYHDQALPVVKHMGFDRAVNVTLGLPFVRTSVDHGTALSLAGTGKADAGSMQAALQLGITLSQ